MIARWISHCAAAIAISLLLAAPGCMQPPPLPCPAVADPICPPCESPDVTHCPRCECPPASKPTDHAPSSTGGAAAAHLEALRRLPRSVSLVVTAQLDPSDPTAIITAWVLLDGVTAALDVGDASGSRASPPVRWPAATAIAGRWIVGDAAALSLAEAPRIDANGLALRERAVRAVPDGPIVASGEGLSLAGATHSWTHPMGLMAASQDARGDVHAVAFPAGVNDLSAFRDEVDSRLGPELNPVAPIFATVRGATWPGAAAIGLLAADLDARANSALRVRVDGDHVAIEATSPGPAVLLARLLALAAARPAPTRPTGSELEATLDVLGRAVVTLALQNPPPSGGGCHMPQAAALTPNLADRACCGGPLDLNHDNRCDDDPARWTLEPWRSLGYSDPYGRLGVTVTLATSNDRTVVTLGAAMDTFCDGTLAQLQRRVLLTRTSDGGCDAILESGTVLTDTPRRSSVAPR